MDICDLADRHAGKPLGGDPDWWRGVVIYQIYPRSYQDSSGNGIGDLKGIEGRLDHIHSLGVDAIWVSPFYPSPMDDFGYDISDYCAVDPMFGSLADFDGLIAAAHDRGIRVIVDLVLSHTSDRHPWFAESRQSRDNPKADWYVWADPKPDGTPPNNWLALFGGVAWEYDTRRGQYYLHNFLRSQPDLNFHNHEVQDAVMGVARFWLDRGVDGCRMDVVNFFFQDKDLRDNPAVPAKAPLTGVDSANPYVMQQHLHDHTQPENLVFLERLRGVLDSYEAVTSVGEVGAVTDLTKTMGAYTEVGKRLHMVYNFELLSYGLSAAHVRAVAEAIERDIGGGWPGWTTSNHDAVRVVTRWGGTKDIARAAPLFSAILLTLRGTAFVYQGEELGLTEADIAFEKLQDPFGKQFWPGYKGRDGCRTPIPWDTESLRAGFSDAEPWLPIPVEHRRFAVADQESDPASVLNRFRKLIAWRAAHPVLRLGSIAFLDQPEPILAYVREYDGLRFLCVFNLSPDPVDALIGNIASVEAVTGHGFEDTAQVEEPDSLHLDGRGAFFATFG